MLIYTGMEGDNAATRGAKLKALQGYFKESDPRALNMLGANDMKTSNANRGKNLVINSHGNINVFAGYTPDAFFAELQTKGLEKGSFEKIYLMACNIGEQAQDNSIYANFAKDFNLKLRQNGMSPKVYAPRGTLTYQLKTETKSGQTYYVVTDMYIRTPERNYPLDEGILLVDQ